MTGITFFEFPALQETNWSKALEKNTTSNPQSCGNDKARIFDILSLGAFLRKQHPQNTAAHVSAKTDISIASIENWLQQRSRPQGEHLLRLAYHYGPSFLKAVINGQADWIDQAVNQYEVMTIEQEIAALKARKEGIKMQ